MSIKTVTHFFSGHSMYAYFGFAKLLSLAEQHRLQIIHKPIDLHEVMIASGSSAFENRSKQQLSYFFGVEAKRWAAFRGVDWLGRIPTHHAKPYDRVNCLLISAQIQGIDIGELALRLLQSHWKEDTDLTDDTVFVEVLRSFDLDPEPIISSISAKEVTDIYRANTEQAKKWSALGSPTYFLGDEMYYGQDRLEMIEWLLNQEG
jgi:2-hydroxychromene-2-carboxylate isomerase